MSSPDGSPLTSGHHGEPVVAATFARPWDAELARNYLAEAGLEAWVEDPYRISGGAGLVRLLVQADRVTDAKFLLGELSGGVELEPTIEPDSMPAMPHPMWVTVAAVVLLGGVVAAAVPRFLWLPAAAIGLIVYWLFRRYRSRRDVPN